MLYGVCMVLILYIQRKKSFVVVVYVAHVFVERGWTILNIMCLNVNDVQAYFMLFQTFW